jgi:hypothetical protein
MRDIPRLHRVDRGDGRPIGSNHLRACRTEAADDERHLLVARDVLRVRSGLLTSAQDGDCNERPTDGVGRRRR